ncbi:MAG: tryptophan--tRNA ligase [bacterium]
MKKQRILSGIQPTGRLHLGNLFGAVLNWRQLQDVYESYFFIADLHALTTSYDDSKGLAGDVFHIMVDLMSAGLDPDRCTIFRQSAVPEHSELHLMLSMITPLPWLERVPTYKAKIKEMKEKDLGTYGFLGYPVLQAADILMYKADYVPVGRDQLPHLELTRAIARRFNFFYGDVFPEPKELLTEFPVLLGTDGRKMSKSYGNAIAISDTAEVIGKKVASMFTDPARVRRTDKGHPGKCPVFSYHKIFDQAKTAEIEAACKKAEIGCVDCKKMISKSLIQYLAPIHSKRSELESKPDFVYDAMVQGASKASVVAKETLTQVKKAIGLI